MPVQPRRALAEKEFSDDDDAPPYTHHGYRGDRPRRPGTRALSDATELAPYRQRVAGQQKLWRHGRRMVMACIAMETLRILPPLLVARPHMHADQYCLYDLNTTHRLSLPLGAPPRPKRCIRVKVVSEDALDAALSLDADQAWRDDKKSVKEWSLALKNDVAAAHGESDSDGDTQPPPFQPRTRKVLLNVTTGSRSELGGLWQEGNIATQEERLCFRTSLSLSLPWSMNGDPPTRGEAGDWSRSAGGGNRVDATGFTVESTAEQQPALPDRRTQWKRSLVEHAESQGWIVTPPLRPGQALYSRDVLVVRNAMHQGNTLLEAARSSTPDSVLPVVSVITVTAVHQPPWRRGGLKRPEYALEEDRLRVKNKMRLALRIAVANEHNSVVLGSLGCDEGLFRQWPGTVAANPADDVAACWREVLLEPEFSGRGWFRDIYFAVPEERGDDTYHIFRKVLHNLEV